MEIVLLTCLVLSLCAAILLGYPVAFTLAGIGTLYALLGYTFGIFDLAFVAALPSRVFGNAMTNLVLIAVPLFVFMGVVLERSRVAEELLDSLGKLFGSLRGGLGISVSIVGALLAASTGIVGATVVTMGLISLPTMLKRHYDPALACGSICAAGTLGQIIPPSIVLVILGDQISNAYIDAQRVIGNWSPEPLSVGDLFAGALIPGLILVVMYIGYQTLVAFFQPHKSPAIVDEDSTGNIWRTTMQAVIPPIILIISVLGSILAGVATPTEAAAVGAIGALLLGGDKILKLNPDYLVTSEYTYSLRLRQSLQRINLSATARVVLHNLHYISFFSIVVLLIMQNLIDLRIQRENISAQQYFFTIIAAFFCLLLTCGILVSIWRLWACGILSSIMQSSLNITSMVFVILVGASLFSLVFRGYGGDKIVEDFLHNLPGGIYSAVFVVMLVIFILGFFIDFIEITFIVVPIVAPILLQNDLISPLWLGIMIAINLQTSFLTPPFGFALFYLRGIAPPSVKTTEIYRGVIPFIIIQLLMMLILVIFPDLSEFLPRLLYGTSFGPG